MIEPTGDRWSDCKPAPAGSAVIIVDGYSTGRYYAPELVRRGYRVYHLSSGIERTSPALAAFAHHVGKDILKLYSGMLEYRGDLDDTVREVNAVSPVAVMVGCESGVEFSELLAHRLGLPANPVNSRSIRRDKYLMQQAVSTAGLRAIRGVLTSDIDEAIAFAETVEGGSVVLKPVRSAGTEGVHFCESVDAVRQSFQQLLGSSTFFGETNDAVLVQEQLRGQEVVVNTVSRQGKHAVSDVWRYHKVLNAGAPVYEHARLAVELDPALEEAASYCLGVLDALQIRQGPGHAEIMLTPDGPCLVEIGARPMGGSFPPELYKECVGHTQIEWSVDAYLNPAAFWQHMEQPYKGRKHLLIKLLISTREGELASVPSVNLLSGLKSMRGGNFLDALETYRVERTIDLFSSPAWVCLAHEDGDLVTEESALVRQLEIEAQNELFELSPTQDWARTDSDWFQETPDELWLKDGEAPVHDAEVIMRALDLQPGVRVLDCPCGDCRVGVHLADCGVIYDGTDINPRFVEAAQRRFAERGYPASLWVSDMRELAVDAQYDVVLNWFNSFGYFGVEDDFDALRRLVRALKPGGRLLMENPNRAFIAAHLPTKVTKEGDSASSRWDEETERVVLSVPAQNGTDRKQVVAGDRIYSPAQLKLLFRLAGLEVEQVWGEDLTPFDESTSKRIILLGRKPLASTQ